MVEQGPQFRACRVLTCRRPGALVLLQRLVSERTMLNSALSDPRLGNLIQGIEATLTLDGRSLRVVVTTEAFRTSLVAGATLNLGW